jgi:hypothetical protein
MDTFLLTSPADQHSHTFNSRKTACPGSIHLLVGKHNVGGTETTHQQATGIKKHKNSEQNAQYLLTIPTSGKLTARGAMRTTGRCSLRHIFTRGGQRVQATRVTLTISRPRKGLGVIVRAGVVVEWREDPCGRPAGYTLVGLTNQSNTSCTFPIN